MSDRNIIDKKQVETVQARAQRLNKPGADFLLQRMLDDLEDRLAVNQRLFENVRLICPASPNAIDQFAQSPKISGLEAAMTAEPDREAERLDLEPRSADLIIDLAHLHQVNDVPGMLVQYNRALKPDGLLLGCVPGGDTLFELRQSLIAAESEIVGGVTPRVLPFMDVRDAGGLLQRAGFALPVADLDSVVVRYDTMFDLMFDLRAMGATNTLCARSKSFSRRDMFARAAAYYADHFSDEDGRIRATFSFIWISGWSPDASQPKPLRPGSAKVSLAEALKEK